MASHLLPVYPPGACDISSRQKDGQDHFRPMACQLLYSAAANKYLHTPSASLSAAFKHPIFFLGGSQILAILDS